MVFLVARAFLVLHSISFLMYLTWINDTADRVFMLKALIFAPFLITSLISVWWRQASHEKSL